MEGENAHGGQVTVTVPTGAAGTRLLGTSAHRSALLPTALCPYVCVQVRTGSRKRSGVVGATLPS